MTRHSQQPPVHCEAAQRAAGNMKGRQLVSVETGSEQLSRRGVSARNTCTPRHQEAHHAQ